MPRLFKKRRFISGISKVKNSLMLERTREIGVMKTLGTTDTDVLKMFIVESILIGFLGGIAGVLLGLISGKMVDLTFSLFRSDSANLFKAPLPFLVSIFILSLVVGFLTGLYPARRARKINALDALRYE